MKKFKRPSAKRTTQVSAAVLALALPFTAHEEGLRTTAYLDSVGVPTICYGETENVRLGDTASVPKCDALLRTKIGAVSSAIDIMVEPEMSPEVHAAFTSWAYNVGLGAARKSTLIRMANEGDMAAACAQLSRWKFAGGKPILAARRERERQLCMKGV